MNEFKATKALLADGLNKYYSEYALTIGCGRQVYFKACTDEGLLFDLASVSKILSTTMLALKFIESGKLCLFDTLSQFYNNCGDKGNITIKDLMTHSSGLSPHILLSSHTENHIDVILSSELKYETGKAVAYSCMGYILLGDILERISGKCLDELGKKYVFEPLEMYNTCYNPIEKTAGGRYEPEIINGVKISVDDENCRYLGGIAGNAGVFSNINDLTHYAAMLSSDGMYKNRTFLTQPTLQVATQDYTPHCEESRGLGFLLKRSSLSPAGDIFANVSFGHTGFTGTSVFINKSDGLFVVLLTNAVHIVGSDLERKSQFLRHKRLLHNCIITEFNGGEIL